MKAAIVSATEIEIQPLVNHLKDHFVQRDVFSFEKKNLSIEVLIAGVGIAATVYNLGKYFGRSECEMAINAGIAAAFSKNLEIGETVQVVSDRFGDLGAEDGEKFIDIFEMGLAGSDENPYEKGQLLNDFVGPGKGMNKLKRVHAITVNRVHGNEASILKISQKYQPDIETMEGAAFFYTCFMEKIECCQVRTVSNYMEKRNTDRWNIPLAVNNLNNFLIEFIDELNEK